MYLLYLSNIIIIIILLIIPINCKVNTKYIAFVSYYSGDHAKAMLNFAVSFSNVYSDYFLYLTKYSFKIMLFTYKDYMHFKSDSNTNIDVFKIYIDNVTWKCSFM